MSYNRDMPTGNCQKCINTFGTLGCCDTISNEWRYNCDDGMRQFDERKPMTNYDLLISKTPEELADYLRWHNDSYSRYGMDWLDWLKSPVEVDK